MQEAARLLRLEITVLKAGTPNQIDVAFAALARERGDALFIQPDEFSLVAASKSQRWRHANGCLQVVSRVKWLKLVC